MASQFILYVLFAGLAAAVNLGLRWLLTHVGVDFWLAVGLAYVSGMAVNFFLNKFMNFKSRERRTLQQMRTFIVVALGGLLLTQALSLTGVALLKGVELPLAAEDVSHVLAVGMVMIYSFLMHRTFTFRQGIRGKLKELISKRQA